MATVSASQPSQAPLAAGRRALLWRIGLGTVSSCFRYRVTGLAAEAAFFALLSLPPFVLGLVGTLGYFVDLLGEDTVEDVRRAIIDVASTALSSRSVREVIVPTLDDVLGGGRIDIVSAGFLLALWSGSRALNVYVDTISIAYGLGGHRGIIRTRALSFSLYVVGLVTAIVVVPMVLVGPELVARLFPGATSLARVLYWPIAVAVTVGALTTLYHVSVPVRTRWRYNLPGSLLAMVSWLAGSWLLRWGLAASVGGPSIYGPLAAPIAVLLWLYVTAIAVLVGAALNAEIDKVLPSAAAVSPRRLPPPDQEESPPRHRRSLRWLLGRPVAAETSPTTGPRRSFRRWRRRFGEPGTGDPRTGTD